MGIVLLVFMGTVEVALAAKTDSMVDFSILEVSLVVVLVAIFVEISVVVLEIEVDVFSSGSKGHFGHLSLAIIRIHIKGLRPWI